MRNCGLIEKRIISGQTCPHCGEQFIFCDNEYCTNFAVYEGWRRSGGMIQRWRVCEKCKMDLIGFQEGHTPEEFENVDETN